MVEDVVGIVFTYVWFGGFGLAALIMVAASICCGESAAAEPRAARVWRSGSPTIPPAVELMRPAVLVAPVVVKKLGYFPYSAEGRSASECVICLGLFEEGEECSEVPACQHLFHRECIDVWMKTNNTTCPLCRRRIVAGSERVSAADDMV